MRVTTKSGTIYEVDKKNSLVRRVDPPRPLRFDGEWLPYLRMDDPEVGKSWMMVLSGIVDGNGTWRTTSPVTSIEDE